MDSKVGTEVGTLDSGNTKAESNKKNKYRNWCFTDFSDDMPKFDKDSMLYLICGKEVCPTTGKKHWQCFVSFRNARYFNGVQACFKGAHIEKCLGNAQSNIDYCMKEKNFTEFGDRPKGKGHRSDLDIIGDKIIEGTFDAKEFGAEFIKWNKGIKVFQDVVDEEKKLLELKADFDTWYPLLDSEMLMRIFNWECQLDCLSQRQLLWICSKQGGIGKSAFATKLMLERKAIILDSTMKKDVACALGNEKVIVFDLSRSMEDYVSYDTIECILNGRIFSGKYESKMKLLNKPKVVVLSNFYPKINALSSDRWVIYDHMNELHTELIRKNNKSELTHLFAA